MGVAKGFDQDHARVRAHWADARRHFARALDDLAPAIRRRRRPWKRQSLHAGVSLSNLRQSDLDRRAADRDAINPVANVGLRGGMVCGQLADGFRDERFQFRGWSPDDRSRFALVTLQSRLRDVIAPALAQALGVEGLLKSHDASRFEIALEQGAHDYGMIIDDVQSAIFDPIAQRNHATHPHSLLLQSGDLVPDCLPVTSRSNWAKDSSTLRVRRPMLVVVLKD